MPTETPVRVALATVEKGEVSGITALRGTLRYEQEYAAIAPVTGIVAQVYVAPGDRVAKGQALARLDTAAEAAAMSEMYALHAEAKENVLPEGIDPAAWTDTAIREKAAVLDAMTLRAAADGQVISIPAGQYSGVVAGSPAVLLCSGEQQVICTASVSDAAELLSGMQADVLVHGEAYCRAEILYIGAAQTDAMTGQTVCMVAMRPDREINLPIGAPVEVQIERFRCSDVPVLPVTAVDENGMVWVVADGRCWEVCTEIVRRDEIHCWVTLPEGTTVVDKPEKLINSQRVKEIRP